MNFRGWERYVWAHHPRPLSTMRPDQPLCDREARTEIEEALQTYAERHQPRDVILYVAHQSDAIGWNELQRRAGLTPQRLRAKLNRVERFLRRQIVGYHDSEG